MQLNSCAEKKGLTPTEINWLQENEITIALFPYYPPYVFVAEDNRINGIFVEYLDAIEEELNFKFNRKYYSKWPEVIADIEDKKIDIIVEIQKTKDRKQYLNFYSELFKSKHVLVTRKKSEIHDSLKDFSNMEIVVPKEYAISENLLRKYPDIKVVEKGDDLQCLQLLNSGKYDAYIGPKPVVNYLIKNKNLNSLKINFETELMYKPGIAIRKDNPILNHIFSKAVANISDEQNQNILENWLYRENLPLYKRIYFLVPIVASIFFLLIILVIVNFYLGFIVKKRTKELRLAKESAEKDNALKTAFLHNVSHEIRSPVNGIVGFSRLLREPKTSLPEKRKYVANVVQSCQQLIKNMDNILEISKLQTNQVTLNPEKTDLIHVFDTITLSFEKKANEKGIQLISNNNIPPRDRIANIDKGKLTKTIECLIENSIKFTQRGAILISGSTQNSSLIISVRDSGMGMNGTSKQSLFKNLDKSEPQISKKYGGLGLGLAIAKKNTELMNGELLFSSIKNQGTTFRLIIPYRPLLEKGRKIENDLNEKNGTDHYTILIAEDGEVNFLFLKTILTKIEDYNFNIHRAHNGKEAVTFCEKNVHIDLVLMDIKMPEMNGYEATQIIKQLRPEIPVVAQTAYSTKEDIQKALSAGCDDFISKPVDPKILKTVLNKYLKKED